MKDLLIRILASAFVGALVSAGLLYFAFDQSLRGIETAVQSTNSRISDNVAAVRALDGKLSSHDAKLDGLTALIDKRWTNWR